MKKLIFLILALLIATVVGLGLYHYPGMLVITVGGWRVDMSLWLAIFLFMGSYFLLHLVYRIFAALFNLSETLQSFFKNYRQRHAKQLTQKGMINFAEGHWLQAERLLIQGAPASQMPWLNYLWAAQAAQKLGADERRDVYLQQAHNALPQQPLAVDLTQAQLQYQHGEFEQSLATLQQISLKAPNHPQVLRLYHDIYLQTQAWEKLLALLPKLKQQHIFAAPELLTLEKKLYQELLTLFLTNQSWESLQALWRKMPANLHQEGELALLYAKALHLHRKPVEAESVLRKALNHQWHEALIVLYGQLSHPQENKVLEHAENWLQNHPESPGLLFALGSICVQLQLWGKAQRYFEASLSLDPAPHTYAALGALLEKLDKPELGAQYYKKGLLLATPNQLL